MCALWGITKSRTTPYHPQSNGVVERGNRDLGDMLRSLLLNRAEDDWDLLLPYIMRSIRASPHQTTSETPNYMMLGREVRLPEHLLYGPAAEEVYSREKYAVEVQKRLNTAHELLRKQQLDIRTEDRQERPLFQVGQLVWLKTKRFSNLKSHKLQPKHSGPYTIVEVAKNHTYLIEQHGRLSREAESRLKAYVPARSEAGRAPNIVESTRQLTRKGMTARKTPLAVIEEEELPVQRNKQRTVAKTSPDRSTEIDEVETTYLSGGLTPARLSDDPPVSMPTPMHSIPEDEVIHSTPIPASNDTGVVLSPDEATRREVVPSTPGHTHEEVMLPRSAHRESGVTPSLVEREDNTRTAEEATPTDNGVAPTPRAQEGGGRPTRERRAPGWLQDFTTHFDSLDQSLANCQTVNTRSSNTQAYFSKAHTQVRLTEVK